MPRIAAVVRLLMQVRLLLVGVTLLLLAGAPLTIDAIVALTAAAFCSWLAAHYSTRIVDLVIRHPLLLGLDVIVAFMVLELGGPLGPFFLFTVVTAAVAGLLFRWRGFAYFCTLQVICYYGVLGMSAGDEAVWTFQAIVGQPAYYPLVGFVGVRVRRLLDEQADLAEERRQAEVHAAAADERARLGRELHDSLAKTVRGIAMSAQALPLWVERSPQRAAEEAKRVAAAAEIASREARDVISDLRTEDLEQPLPALLRDVTERWAAETGVSAHVELVEDVDMSILARYEAIAVLKEGLTNVERHASASRVTVSFRNDNSQGVMSLTDDGCGFDPEVASQSEGHYGLVGMRERAARANAQLTVTSNPGEGTTVCASFPLGHSPTEQPPASERAALSTSGIRGLRPRSGTKPAETS